MAEGANFRQKGPCCTVLFLFCYAFKAKKTEYYKTINLSNYTFLFGRVGALVPVVTSAPAS